MTDTAGAIARAKALLEAASPGPWYVESVASDGTAVADSTGRLLADFHNEANAQLAALVHEVLTVAIQEAEALEGLVGVTSNFDVDEERNAGRDALAAFAKLFRKEAAP